MISDIRYEKKHWKKVWDHTDHKWWYPIRKSDQWNAILQETLTSVYKHSDTDELRELVRSLLHIDKMDISQTGIHFLQEYMRIVARIPANQINLPFHK